MPLRMDLWKVEGSGLQPVLTAKVTVEQRLEDWLANDPALTGLDILVIGRQVSTPNRGRVDLLAIDAEANTVVLELKRDKTPREVVAQILDYASWVQDLSFADLDAICQRHRQKPLAEAYRDHFGAPLPETINDDHSLVVVATELDESSERIVRYLGDRGIQINAIFFNLFQVNEQELVGRAWFRDPADIQERADSRHKAPWSGYWFVNVGEGLHRNWDDNVKYGYVGAGGGEWYSQALRRLQVGDRIFAYMRGLGYVGYGEVTDEARPAADVQLEDGKPLLQHEMRAASPGDYGSDPRKAEWAVRVRWLKTFPREQARTFSGVFANQNIVLQASSPGDRRIRGAGVWGGALAAAHASGRRVPPSLLSGATRMARQSLHALPGFFVLDSILDSSGGFSSGQERVLRLRPRPESGGCRRKQARLRGLLQENRRAIP